MKTGRPKAAKTMPGKIAPKMGGAPPMAPGGLPGMGGQIPGMKKGGKVKGNKK